MGNYYYERKEFERAVEMFERVVKVTPDFTDAWFNLGNAYGKLQNNEKAIVAYKRALRYKGDFASALKNLGYIYEQTKAFAQAEECYRKAIEANNTDAGLYSNLGALYTKQNRFDEAKEYFVRAVKLSPVGMAGWMGLRHLSLVKGDIATYVRSTLAIFSRLGNDAVAQAAAALRELEHFEECDTILARADVDSRTGYVLDSERLLSLQRKGVQSGTVVALEKRLASLVAPPESVRLGLACYYFNGSQYDKVIRLLSNIDNKKLQYHTLLWRAFIGQKEFEHAEKKIQEYLEGNADCGDAWFYRAKVHLLRGEKEPAREAIVRALENGFTHPDIFDNEPELKSLIDSLSQPDII
jgi:tetratricopeptide (TPR) repeat protein